MNKWKQSNEHRKKIMNMEKNLKKEKGIALKNVRFSKLVRTTYYKVMVLCKIESDKIESDFHMKIFRKRFQRQLKLS